jgi:hypothetical protein
MNVDSRFWKLKIKRCKPILKVGYESWMLKTNVNIGCWKLKTNVDCWNRVLKTNVEYWELNVKNMNVLFWKPFLKNAIRMLNDVKHWMFKTNVKTIVENWKSNVEFWKHCMLAILPKNHFSWAFPQLYLYICAMSGEGCSHRDSVGCIRIFLLLKSNYQPQ